MANKSIVYEKIENIISSINVGKISKERKEILSLLIDYVQAKVNEKENIRLNFICTHNSRRSHLAQVWAQTMAYYFNVGNVHCYSGGTEATALFHLVAKTLGNNGFKIEKLSEGNNPIYSIKYAENEHPIIGFSKKYDDKFNPTSGYAAIMVCSSADADCPFIAGTEMRIPITFEDPKAFDNTSQQADKYTERSLHIATELFYVFSQINH